MSVFLGLGTNLGDRLKNLEKAICLLIENRKLLISNYSGIYKTEPKHFVKQPFFLNMVLEVETELDCFSLLSHTKKIEKKMHREKKPKNHPRIIDIDILAYKKSLIRSQELVVPHPLITERNFVLIPWSEISQHYILPGVNVSLKKLIEDSNDLSKVEKYRKHQDVNIPYSN